MILIINSGSSSIKFGLYEPDSFVKKISYGQINRIGLPAVELISHNLKSNEKQKFSIKAADYSSTIIWLINWLEKQVEFSKITAIGHRVVHGMHRTEPCLITPQLLKEMKNNISCDPEHLPNEIKLIEAFIQHHPKIIQFACFDTVFHQTMPRVAKLLPIPRRFDRLGIHRYGFHGLSYNYMMLQLEKLGGKDNANGRVILAHLGNGASITAVHQGKSIDTSMGFTPSSGIPMSSRSGDLDPGVASFIMKTENLSAKEFNHLTSYESGLLGISETSADMIDLLKQEASDPRSAEAVALFCYQAKKCIGAFAAALGGIDTLIFSGGIGENAPVIRTRICAGLSFLGIDLDENSNGKNESIISIETARVTVRVIHTDEEWMIAKIVSGMKQSMAV
jgi:acetate kinase